jgi:REP element-mobilizing transposase RayT
MPRDDLFKGRYSQTNQIYHVTICTEQRITWFADFYCGRLVVRQMRLLHEDNLLNSLAWVIMPDHVHWLFQLGENTSLSAVIKAFKGRTALALNSHVKRQGSIWQRGFYDHAVRRDEDIKHLARYIVANPLRAGLVEQIGGYSLWDAIWL